MRHSLLLALGSLFHLLLLTTPLNATGLRVADARLETAPGKGPFVDATVEWQNGWRSGRNHDGAWLFVKLSQGGRYAHGRLAASGHTISPLDHGPKGEIEVPPDRVGAFCVVSSGSPHRGATRFRVRLALDPEALSDFDAKEPVVMALHGVEMVLVPEAAFTLGDPGPAALDFGAFYKAGVGGVPDGLFEIASERAFEVGGYKGRLDYRARDPLYQGDRLGPVPDAFPKGFRAFWLMKYELTQGEYAAFLNALGGHETSFRAIHGGCDYAKERGSIELMEGRYAARHPERPANFVSWDDGCAWADWAGLRPFTELEFEKASRGTGTPVAGEFPWGTASRERLLRRVKPDDDLARSGEADEARLSDATREVLGASFYWVMDLAGSVWEKCVPRSDIPRAAHSRGRTETGASTRTVSPRTRIGRRATSPAVVTAATVAPAAMAIGVAAITSTG